MATFSMGKIAATAEAHMSKFVSDRIATRKSLPVEGMAADNTFSAALLQIMMDKSTVLENEEEIKALRSLL